MSTKEGKLIVYGLVDPRDGQLRYIGKSTTGMKRPRSEFVRIINGWEGKGYRHNWIKELQVLGLMYSIVIIQRVLDKEILSETERFWISYFRDIGCPLTNLTDGGDGCSGYRHTQETKDHLSQVNKGRRPSDLCLEASLAVTRGSKRPHTEETKVKISESKRGQKHRAKTLQELLNMSRASGGKPFVDQNGIKYNTLTEAFNATGVDRASVSAVLRGRYKQCNGYVFKHCE